MTHLYEISSDYRRVLDRVDEADGVLDETLEADLDQVAGEFADKVEACAVVMAELEAEAEAIRREEQRLAARRKALEGGRERLKDYVGRCLVLTGSRKVKGLRFTISLRSSTSVAVDCATETLPRHLVRSVTTTSPDKVAIKAELEAGVVIPGASLVTKDSVQIR